jgi:maltose-binding protein MalE
VTVWADETAASALAAIAGDFTTRRGTSVEIVEVPFASIRRDVVAAEDPPDLFVGAAAWTGELRDAGAINAVRGIPQEGRNGFIQPALNGFVVDGALYGVPYAAETIALWVNVDLAGSEPVVTFDELLDRCDDLRGDAVCLAVAGGAGIPEAYYQYPFITAFGGSIFRYEDGVGYVADRAGIDEPESVAASVFLAAIGRGDYLPPLDYVTAKRRFLEGEVAFWLTGPWEAEAIAEAEENRGFTATVIPVPPIDGAPARPFVDAFGLFLATGASTEAKIFLTDWLATGGAMLSLAPAAPLLPAHEEAAARLADPSRTPFLEALRIGVPTPNLAVMTDQIWDTWGSALTTIRDERADPATTLAEAARVIRGVLGLPQPPPEG